MTFKITIQAYGEGQARQLQKLFIIEDLESLMCGGNWDFFGISKIGKADLHIFRVGFDNDCTIPVFILRVLGKQRVVLIRVSNVWTLD